MDRSNTLTSGHRACQGCGEALGARYALDAAMRATDGQLIAANATGCLEVFSTPYPGVVLAAALDPLAVRQRAGRGDRHRRGAEGRRAAPTCASSGRAATAAPSTSASRACPGCSSATTTCSTSATTTRRYMNTGVQRSGATPPGGAHREHEAGRGPSPATSSARARTLPLIAMAHEIPYVATATVADLRDLEDKVERAMEFRGARYLHVFVPCPLGWGSASRRHDPDRPAGQGDRALPGLRGRARRGHRASRRSAGRSRSRSTCGRSAATRICSATRRAPT